MSAPEKNYKDTILLPETGFPMRGDLTKNEPVRLKKWEDTGLYERYFVPQDGTGRTPVPPS